MRLLVALTAAVLFVTPLSLAQSAPSPLAPHVVPFASEANTLELTIANRSGEQAIRGAVVVLTSAPEWVRVDQNRLDVGDLDVGAEGPVTFSFDVDRGAPVGEPAEVVLEVRDGDGRLLERKPVRLQVAAPAALALHLPRPNPARGPAIVPFEVPVAGNVRLTAYDVLGREVTVLVDGEREPGAHEARLDAGRLAVGVYVVRLVAEGEAGPEAAVRRLTVVR